jgi:hypothetical protein
MHGFEKNILGETDNLITVDTSGENALAALQMAQQSIRTLDIISPELDPAIYNNAEFVEAVKQMVLKNRRARVRMLAHEPATIVRRGHRLVDLAMQLTSFIEIRVPGQEHIDIRESLLIADTAAYIHRLNPERFEAKLNFNDKRTARLMSQQFDEMWEKSRSDPNFKRALL